MSKRPIASPSSPSNCCMNPSTSGLPRLKMTWWRGKGCLIVIFFFSSRRRHTRSLCDWSSDVCSSDLANQRAALAQLGQNRDDYEKGVRSANRDLEKVSRLLEDVEMFKALLERQKNVERQARSYKDLADPGLDEQIRLKEFSEEQGQVEGALAQLKEDFQAHAQEVESDYPKVAQDARKIAEEIRKRQIEDLMESASTRLAWADARGGHEKAQEAYQEMQAMVGVCNSAGGEAQAECELRLKMTMNMALGKTLQQLAKA